MINPIDYVFDKSNYAAQGTGILGGVLGMMLWLFPLQIWTGILGFILTIFTTAVTTFTVLVITGIYQKNKQRILKFFVIKIVIKKGKHGKPKKEVDNQAA